jgi:sulfate adenylyltransferase
VPTYPDSSDGDTTINDHGAGKKKPAAPASAPSAERRVSPPIQKPAGFCVWFTGLSGSGKTTTAEVLLGMLTSRGRTVTYLDGDVVRLHLSKGLGFTRADRDTNILRIGFVAAEIIRHGGAVITAAISPYRVTRDEVRAMVGPDHFIEVFVDTPIEVCEKRDVKGMYARARRGEISTFTGIDDPYEPPLHPEIILDTVHESVQENASRIIAYLEQHGFLDRGVR